jgi:hypothetical protein
MNQIRAFTVGEFRGNFPQIETDSRVDLDALTENDESPFFVTLPIARVGEVSANGLQYDEELVKAIMEQAVGKGGIMGHLKPEERNTAFPIEDVDWVGVTRVEDTAWGKAYVPPGEAREYIRRLMARGGKLATSIYGPYEKQLPGEADGSHRIRGLRLESLDLAPADRAALQLGGQFAVTAQMNDEIEGDDEMPTKDEVIAELTANDIPQTVREQIVSDWQQEHETEDRIAELEQERDDANALVETLQGQLEKYAVREFEAALDNQVSELVDWEVKGEEAQSKVESLQRTVRRQILAELGDERDPEKVEEVAAEVWEELKPLAETIRSALSGPAAVVSGKVRDSHKIEDTPEARKRARAQMGW